MRIFVADYLQSYRILPAVLSKLKISPFGLLYCDYFENLPGKYD